MSGWQDILSALFIAIGILFACTLAAVGIVRFEQWRIARKERQINKAREVE